MPVRPRRGIASDSLPAEAKAIRAAHVPLSRQKTLMQRAMKERL